MSRHVRRKEATDARTSTIGDLPTDIIHKILALMPIQDAARTSIFSKQWRQMWTTLPHLVFDCQFFYHATPPDNRSFDAGIIHKVLMLHTGPILGFHLISYSDHMANSDINQCIIFVSKHGIQKLTIDFYNLDSYKLPCGMMTCLSLTHLKLSEGVFKLSDCIKLPNLVSLELKRASISRGSDENTLILPLLETLKLDYCRAADCVPMKSPKLENLSILHSIRCASFICLDLSQIFKSIKYLCMDGPFIDHLVESLEVSARLVQPLKLQHLKVSVKHISCALFLVGSPDIEELDIGEAVEVDEGSTVEVFSYLSNAKNEVKESLRMIRTVRLSTFKGSRSEMYLIKFLLAHSPKLERMIVQRSEGYDADNAHSPNLAMMIENAQNCVEHLKELISYPRASPKAVFKYL